MLRNRMHVVLWALLVLFLLSMTVGGLVGGANIIDQLLGRVNPAEAIGLVNGQKITPNQFNQAVNAQMDAIRNSGSQVSDQDLERVRSQVWNGFIEEYLTNYRFKQNLDNSIVVSSTHETNSEIFLFNYLEENNLIPKIIISDEVGLGSPYIKFIKERKYKNDILIFNDKNNFLDPLYIGIAYLP